jgi:type IV pilus assembly protein PilN
MIRFNLLPWRDAQRRERKRAFNGNLLLAALLGFIVVLVVSGLNAASLADQSERHALLDAEIAVLDKSIREIASLRQDIDTLKARQSAVETLQANRNQPVYLMDELASLVPSGVILKSIKQADTIIISGYAQSNARVSELLRNLGTQAHWLTQPELVEIKSASYGQGKDARKIFEFNLSVSLARTPLERQ